MATELSTNTAPARGLALASMDDAFRFAKMVASSEFAPKDFRGKPESCLLAIQHGSEIGLAPMQSLQCIAVINGRPSIWGDAAKALCLSSANCEWITEDVTGEGDAMVAICTAKRRGNPTPTVSRFSVADAKVAKLWGKRGRDGQDTPWVTSPKRMLQLRARGFALRDAFPDVLKGLVTAEEAQDYPAAEPARTPQAKPTPTPEPVARPEATDADMIRVRLAISKAKTSERLLDIKQTVEQRTDEGFYTSVQTSELFDLIDTRRELLTPKGDAYEPEEVQA